MGTVGEIGKIVKDNKRQYMERYSLTHQQHKAIEAIEKCRTAQLGGHILQCDRCNHKQKRYNSCRNRHCPKCQGAKQQQWAEKVKQHLLPCRYFHLVFTIPGILNDLVYSNQSVMYDILIKSAAGALLQVCDNPRFLGARTGCLSVLHTWGQNLMLHPHVHMLVPAGGLSEDGWEWIPSGKKFFVPVKVLSRIFRAKFMAMTKQAFNKKKVKPVMDISFLKEKLYAINWNVYCKKTMGGPAKVITYLGRYTHRVAISNNRILSSCNGKVSFRWKDYRDKFYKWKVMELEQLEFIRRFLLHVLPNNFYKIRYYGIYSLACRSKMIGRCLQLLGIDDFHETQTQKAKNFVDSCPVCKIGKLMFAGFINQVE